MKIQKDIIEILFNTTQNKAAFLFKTDIAPDSVVNYRLEENMLEITVSDGQKTQFIQQNNFEPAIYRHLGAFDAIYVLTVGKLIGGGKHAYYPVTMAYRTA